MNVKNLFPSSTDCVVCRCCDEALLWTWLSQAWKCITKLYIRMFV